MSVPFDWDAAVDRHWMAEGDVLRRCTDSLTWVAFEASDRDEWTATLRHELVHVEQCKRYGPTDHGTAFERLATALEAPMQCRRFAPPNYVLRCASCGAVVARRYRDCKLVREDAAYVSNCGEAAIRCIERDETH